MAAKGTPARRALVVLDRGLCLIPGLGLCRQQQAPPQRRMQDEAAVAPRVMARSASNDYLGPQGQGMSFRPGGGPAGPMGGRGGPSRDASPSCALLEFQKPGPGCGHGWSAFGAPQL